MGMREYLTETARRIEGKAPLQPDQMQLNKTVIGLASYDFKRISSSLISAAAG
jgi:hypothetical protein